MINVEKLARDLEPLLEKHAPWSQKGRATCGCGITPMRVPGVPFHKWWARHMAQVIAAEHDCETMCRLPHEPADMGKCVIEGGACACPPE